MALDALHFDQSVSGLLVDGVESTPFTGAILKLENPRGVVVEVPYVVGDSSGQFTHVKEWFEEQTPPKNMILETPDGPIGLYGIRWRGHSMKAGVSLGKLAPRETLLGRCESPLSEPLLLDEVHSRIDGLREWTGMNSIDFLPETDDHGLSIGLTVNVRSLEGGTIYREFTSKQEILDALLTRSMERMTTVSRELLGETEHPSLSRAYAVGVQVLLDDPLMTAAFLDDHGVLGSYVDAVHDDRYRARHHFTVEWITALQDRGALSRRVDATSLALALSSATIGLLTAAKHLGPLTRDNLRSAIEALAMLVSLIEIETSQ
ncbi:MAG: TetR/AcrR family transcriptional regulator [Leucobacter sp.]